MKLVKFVCVAASHSGGRSDSALTIHEGQWAFCAMGADQKGHEWQPSDGLPLADAMRFTPREAADVNPSAPRAPKAAPQPVASAKGKTRSR